MIYLLTKAKKTYTFLSFLNTWGGELRKITTVLPIEKMVRAQKFHSGTYILTDYDLLSEKQTELLRRVYNGLNQFPDKVKLINQPGISLSRIELLNKLYASRINTYRCFRATEIPENIEFPVFVRKGKDHYGKITDLINSPDELKHTISKTESEGFDKSEILIVEFINTSDENHIFRKYSAFLVDKIVIPRHIFISKKWMIKDADLADNSMIAEEVEYIKTNPHEKQIKKVFELAGMNYGRIDYSIKDGNIVVWEINPNPMIASSSSLKKSKRINAHDLFVQNFVAAFKQIDLSGNGKIVPIPLRISEKYRNEIETAFPFNRAIHWFSDLFQNTKSITLFNFYSIRNRYKK